MQEEGNTKLEAFSDDFGGMDQLKKLISLQKKEGLTNLEMAYILEIPDNTWETWRNKIRSPTGPSLSLIKTTLEILKNGKITRDDLLKKTGR